jgi:hypothetical protein
MKRERERPQKRKGMKTINTKSRKSCFRLSRSGERLVYFIGFYTLPANEELKCTPCFHGE